MDATTHPGAHETETEAEFWRPLLHRWFVEYNPLYLASSLLVLAGLTLVSRSTGAPTLEGELDVVAIVAELYAFALIGGAWLLTRIGLRRPAVLLALLAVLYQADLTLLTERSAYLGLGGEVAVVVWLGVFAGKLVALAAALRLKLSRSALAVPMFGALAVAVLPHLLDGESSSRRSAVALVTFAVLAAGLWTRREVTSAEVLDAWGEKVLRRSLRAAWAVWTLLFLAHVGFSCIEHQVSAIALGPAAMLLATRWLRNEASVFGATAATLVLAAWLLPDSFSTVALMGSMTLSLRALRLPSLAVDEAPPRPARPYRLTDVEPAPWIRAARVRFAPAQRASAIRLGTGALIGVYLAIWTSGWSVDSFPVHCLALDLALAGVLALAAWRWRAPAVALGPILATSAHAAIQSRLVTAPGSAFAWGETAITAGFVMLFVSLGVSYRLRPARRPSTEAVQR